MWENEVAIGDASAAGNGEGFVAEGEEGEIWVREQGFQKFGAYGRGGLCFCDGKSRGWNDFVVAGGCVGGGGVWDGFFSIR